jgi:small basic protein (TIGR04137 family)
MIPAPVTGRIFMAISPVARGDLMSLDRSLKSANALVRHRNVLTRGERLEKLKEEEKWTDARSPLGLPKVAHRKAAVVKTVKEEVAEGAVVAGAAPAAGAPAAAGAKGAAPTAGAKGAAAGAKGAAPAAKGAAPAAGAKAAAPAGKKK